LAELFHLYKQRVNLPTPAIVNHVDRAGQRLIERTLRGTIAAPMTADLMTWWVGDDFHRFQYLALAVRNQQMRGIDFRIIQTSLVSSIDS
jgi:hypothetical protein